MPLPRRTETDKITRRTLIRIENRRWKRGESRKREEPRTPEERCEVAAFLARLDFEVSIAPIEREALSVRREHWEAIGHYGSHGWYAQRMLSLISRVRTAREDRPGEALWAAVLLGHALAESAAKGWPIVANVRRGSVQGGKERGKEIREDQERLRELIRTEAVAYRRTHPYDRMGSNTSRLSQYLAARCSTEDAPDGQRAPLKPDTVRKHLNELGIK